MKIKRLEIDGFKGFKNTGSIDLTNINLFFGGNSSGKSTVIQALMLLKQTIESKSNQFDLLLNGKYINLGSSKDIINKEVQENGKSKFAIGIELEHESCKEDGKPIKELNNDVNFIWTFMEDLDRVNNIVLDEFFVKTDNKTHNFKSKNNEGFLSESNKSDIYKVEMKNLTPSYIFVKYNILINRLFHDLLDEIYELVVENNTSNKKIKWNKELDIVKEYNNIIESFFKIRPEVIRRDDDDQAIFNDLIKGLIDFIGDIKKSLHIEYLNEILEFIMQNIIYSLKREDLKQLESIITNYKTKFNKIVDDSSSDNFTLRRSDVDFYNIYLIEETNNDIAEVVEAKNTLEEILESVNYLGPIRERPKSIYEYESDQDPMYVGKHGQYFPGILAYFSQLPIEVPMPNGEIKNNIYFIDALNEWIKYIGIGDDIHTKVSSVLSVNVKSRGVESNIINVGVGVSQVLPVIAMGLLSKKTDILIYEQPELHLHPYAQSKLIDFFVLLSKLGKQIIIESHSEYFLHRLRYKILNKEIDQKDINVLFFGNSIDGIKVKKAKLGEFGEIEYPRGFKDETEALIDKLLKAQLDRLRNE